MGRLAFPVDTQEPSAALKFVCMCVCVCVPSKRLCQKQTDFHCIECFEMFWNERMCTNTQTHTLMHTATYTQEVHFQRVMFSLESKSVCSCRSERLKERWINNGGIIVIRVGRGSRLRSGYSAGKNGVVTCPFIFIGLVFVIILLSFFPAARSVCLYSSATWLQSQREDSRWNIQPSIINVVDAQMYLPWLKFQNEYNKPDKSIKAPPWTIKLCQVLLQEQEKLCVYLIK